MKKLKINKAFSLEEDIILHHGDSLSFLKTIPDDAIKLIVSSPPYNIGKEYETRVNFLKYLEVQEEVLKELKRILHQEGSICWQVGNYVEKGEVFPLDIYYYGIFKDLGLKLRNRIIWHFGHGLHASKRFSGRYETILWFTKTDNYTFNLDAVRVPQKYPGKRSFKGKNKGQLSGNPLGKNPSDFWEVLEEDWNSFVWKFPNVKANHPEKTIHPCQFPIELVERCVLALTNERDFVLDPYSGVGSTLIAGLKNKRKVVGVDKEEKYIKITKERILKFFENRLPIRPIGKKIYVPTGKEKVSKVPEEWSKKKQSKTEIKQLDEFIKQKDT